MHRRFRPHSTGTAVPAPESAAERPGTCNSKTSAVRSNGTYPVGRRCRTRRSPVPTGNRAHGGQLAWEVRERQRPRSIGTFLVSLRPPHMDPVQPVQRDVATGEADEVAAPECAGESHQRQGGIAAFVGAWLLSIHNWHRPVVATTRPVCGHAKSGLGLVGNQRCHDPRPSSPPDSPTSSPSAVCFSSRGIGSGSTRGVDEYVLRSLNRIRDIELKFEFSNNSRPRRRARVPLTRRTRSSCGV